MLSAWSPLASSRERGWGRSTLGYSLYFFLDGSPADGCGLLGDGHALFYVAVKVPLPRRLQEVQAQRQKRKGGVGSRG